jgi:serine protease inhibitor
MISKVFEELDPLTICVLANVIYFKGSWKVPFGDAIKDSFTLEDGITKVDALLMNKVDNYTYSETSTYQAVAIPY